MAHTCCCTNQCPACGRCCQVGCEHRRGWDTYTSPRTIPNVPITPETTPTTRRPMIGLTPRKPLTEEGLERILKEAFAEALKELRKLLGSDKDGSS